VRTISKPVVGAEKVAALLARAAIHPGFLASTTWLNGMPGIEIDLAGTPIAVSFVVMDGRITHIYSMANPFKLTSLVEAAELRR
jgi:RNA polymerase sigma-70 factor (ECF subfamily)